MLFATYRKAKYLTLHFNTTSFQGNVIPPKIARAAVKALG
jgi:hypothetical protein